LGCGNSTDKLIAQLSDVDPVVRRAAARALGEQQGQSEDAVAALGHAIEDSDVEVREIASSALGQMGPAAAASRPALESALEDRDLPVRLAAALAIQKIAPTSRSYERVLIASLRAGHGPVFLEVGRMGTDADWAAPTLVALLSHPKSPIRALAAQTLGEIGVADSNVKSALQRSLRDDHPAVRKAAQQALEQIQLQPTTTEP
jgi:HEAT repeat protein